jgi:lipopolysaccharide/colanic/teichoic acid biosynthesis glycosyltransferase
MRLPGEVNRENTLWAVPRGWRVTLPAGLGRSIDYLDLVRIDPELWQEAPERSWLMISNGRFVAHVNQHLLGRVLADTTADAVAVMADPQLCAYQERARLTQQGQLVGYRRLYQDSLEPIPAPVDWPHHLFVRAGIADAILRDGLPREFPRIAERLRSRELGLKTLAIAGSVVDVNAQDGLLTLAAQQLPQASFPAAHGQGVTRPQADSPARNGGISPQARFVGPVLLGNHVSVESDAMIIGPSILCDNSTVGMGAVVDASIVGSGGIVAGDHVVRSAIVAGHLLPPERGRTAGATRPLRIEGRADDNATFRSWPRLSYVRCIKRVADVIVAIIVLLLFAPVLPFIALAVKFNSPGPAFYKDKRQGRHGKLFQCIKFRTMKVGADQLQEKLRFVSEVDGPQFKMADDPRITSVGRFLRETYLDEIPQFCNVLMGDMSVVGPRPSPESENTLCPWWRDARLSVRPGITGLWQVCRTRRPGKDFQEWIHYDTRYVRELSWRLDLWIYWRTFRRMVANFISQF